MSDDSTPPFDGPQLGETVDGLTLVAVGIRDTFTEVIPSHLAAFTQLNEWMNGIRLYELEDAMELDANFWDELLDCDYEVGEGEIDGDQPGEVVTIYDVWVDAQQAEACLGKLQARLDELKTLAIELLPPGLHQAARSHVTPLETLKLIAQLAD
ncbi:MAG: hypothetical protein RL303_1445 [Verrucomicrobiota bacterium]